MKIENISKAFGDKKVFEGLSLDIEDKKISCIMGASGCGKTTLLRIIAGLETADQGTVAYEGKIAFVFQEDRLIEEASVARNLRMICGDEERIKASLSELLLEDCMSKPAYALSGGMKRRVAIARAFLSGRDIILMDEPFTGLDTDTKRTVVEYIQRNSVGKTILLVSHDAADAEALNAEVIVLS